MNRLNIPPEGEKKAKLAIVGEAPGKHEMLRGRPFVGPAGQHLTKMLAQAGIVREDLWITNAVKYEPGNINHIIQLDKKVKETTEFHICKEILIRELQELDADVIIPMGNVPLYMLTGLKDITKRRGSVLYSDRLPGKKIIPTIHPAAALRQYIFTYFIVHDLQRAKQELSLGPLEDRVLYIEPTFAESIAFLEECLRHKEIAFDIETKRTVQHGSFQDWEISCLSLAYDEETAICIPFLKPDSSDYFDPEQEAAIWHLLQELLVNPVYTIVGQNLMFDASFIEKKLGIRINNLEDTMVQAGILFPDFPKGLDFLTSMYTREPYYKDEGKQYIRFGGDLTNFWTYSAKDSTVLLEIHRKQKAELERRGNLPVYQETINLMYALLSMQKRGIRMDVDGMKIASEALLREIEDSEHELRKIAQQDLNPRSPDQLKNYFYVQKGLRPYIQDGKPTTNEKALKQLTALGHPEAAIILKIRELSKLRGTYMDMTLDADNRLRCSFNPVGTQTGRLSSSKTIFSTGGNMQNLPARFKRYLLADPGYLIYDMDLSQAENRIVAFVAPEPKMIEAFETGIDVHSLTGALISGKTIEEVAYENSKGLNCSLGQGNRTWRFWGKTANHSLNYGLGVNSFATRFEVPKDVAKFVIEKYHQAYPGVRQYHNWIKESLRRNRTLENLLGRKRSFLGRWEDSLFKEAFAHIPQSSVADIINQRGLNFCYREFRKEVGLLNQVHDSLVFQISTKLPAYLHAEILLAIKDSLETSLTWMGASFVIPVEAGVGHNLGALTDVPLTDKEKLVLKIQEVMDGK